MDSPNTVRFRYFEYILPKNEYSTIVNILSASIIKITYIDPVKNESLFVTVVLLYNDCECTQPKCHFKKILNK